jgi:hypothetical protein
MIRTGLAAALAMASLACSIDRADAAELPTRKPGLWEIKIKITGGVMPTAKMLHCTDEKTDREMSTMFNPMRPLACEKREVGRVEDYYTIDSICRFEGKSVTMHSDVKGDFTSKYTVITETKTREEEGTEPTITDMTLEATYLGACKPSQKPGDVTMAGGMTVNIKDLEKFQKMLKR